MTRTPGNILFVGDSITTGNQCAHGGYPSHTITYLHERDGSGWAEAPHRYAKGGYTTHEMKGVIDGLISYYANTGTPDYVFLYMGANDDYPLNDIGDWTHINASHETVWKESYTYIIEAIHTAYPLAIQFIGKSYRTGGNGEIEGWLPQFIFPWTDDLVASISYLYSGIKGYEILMAAYPDSLKTGDNVHPSCLGHQLLAQGIRDEIFGLGGLHNPQQMSGGMQSLEGGMNG
jgi:lysophospholipase L1-like esterase